MAFTMARDCHENWGIARGKIGDGVWEIIFDRIDKISKD
jgi:hypothetical protein